MVLTQWLVYRKAESLALTRIIRTKMLNKRYEAFFQKNDAGSRHAPRTESASGGLLLYSLPAWVVPVSTGKIRTPYQRKKKHVALVQCCFSAFRRGPLRSGGLFRYLTKLVRSLCFIHGTFAMARWSGRALGGVLDIFGGA